MPSALSFFALGFIITSEWLLCILHPMKMKVLFHNKLRTAVRVPIDGEQDYVLCCLFIYDTLSLPFLKGEPALFTFFTQEDFFKELTLWKRMLEVGVTETS